MWSINIRVSGFRHAGNYMFREQRVWEKVEKVGTSGVWLACK